MQKTLLLAAAIFVTACAPEGDTTQTDSQTTAAADTAARKSKDATLSTECVGDDRVLEQSTADALLRTVSGTHRSEKNRERDIYRQPVKTLEFFGMRADMTVVELWPGGGWYAEVIAPTLKDSGRYVAATYGSDAERDYQKRLHKALVEKLTGNPAVYGNPAFVEFYPPEKTTLGEPNSADMVLTFRNTHGWLRDGLVDDVYSAAFNVLKPGGVFGVVQHRGFDDADPIESAKTGYVPEPAVISAAEAAGFVLDACSPLHHNVKDTRDHPEGVWTLPPSLELGETDKEKYTAIGESDRMTLRFVKPNQ